MPAFARVDDTHYTEAQTRDWFIDLLLAEPEAYPPIALLAEPVLRLGGVRISPATGCRQRTFRFTGLRVQPVTTRAPRSPISRAVIVRNRAAILASPVVPGRV